MKLIRFGAPEQEKPGVILADGSRRDVSEMVHDYDEGFWASAQIDRLKERVASEGDLFPLVDEGVRLGPPVARPSKLICIGLNYADHARESGMEPPKEPVVFFKATSAIVGPNDDLRLPQGSKKTDWEVELAVLISRKASFVSEAEANQHVGGYLLHNDYSERSYQLERGGQWVKGKSCDTFAPLGPWLLTPDEMPSLDDLQLWLDVNGERRQTGSTKELIFSVPTLISYLSHFMTLLPGDIISTGTPPGVGLGMNPPTYLKAGDKVRLGIEGLGESEQLVVA